MLTIKQFSRITAIPETTLRYYEKAAILPPAGRTEAGYRLYAPDQILPAKFLYSLRLAEVPLDEVREYHAGGEGARHDTLQHWHQELGARIAWLTMARRYVETLLGGAQEPVHLQVTPAIRVLWFTREGPTGHFGSEFFRLREQMKRAGIATTDEYFCWIRDLDAGRVQGDLGFQLAGRRTPGHLPDGARLEERPSSLTLSIEHRGPFTAIPETHARLAAFMQAHGWEPVGPHIERYPDTDPGYTEILCPILHLEGNIGRD